MEQEELTPDWLSLRHRVTFALRRLRGGSSRLPTSASRSLARPR